MDCGLDFPVFTKTFMELTTFLSKCPMLALNPILKFLDKRRTNPEIVLNIQCLTSFHEHWFSILLLSTIEEGNWLHCNDLVIKCSRLPTHLSNGYTRGRKIIHKWKRKKNTITTILLVLFLTHHHLFERIWDCWFWKAGVHTLRQLYVDGA